MCGRTALALDPTDIQSRTGAVRWSNPDSYRSSRNVAPTRYQPVLRKDTENGGQRYLQCMKWGLIPSWTKQLPTYANALQTINARDDRLKEGKSMWSGMKHSKRCVVIAEGFFEWVKKGKERQPYYVQWEDKRLMYFAGLWDRATIDGQHIESYTIITTSSSNALSWLHDRMPAILRSEEEVDKWLDPNTKFTDDIARLIRPTEEGLSWYPVSKFVSKTGNDSVECVTPIELKPEPPTKPNGNIMNFFKKAAPKSTEKTSERSGKSSSPAPKASLQNWLKKEDGSPTKRKRDDDHPREIQPEEDMKAKDEEPESKRSKRDETVEEAGDEVFKDEQLDLLENA
ncbi:uncharacterized protein EV422DRAFT_546407 [Fimicolochytrium jonesii]|uniref:uncharacterized protein n=1 Tax=Fimicolochytrium jonesii TaxID=1396493 RepID=UPI0022FEBAD2|nr:uncharacterized protein EV422DRAFT_546407 [Fimicolochytrium jonesii]KAI8816356.1 hypothetical protein EV422DRAFT_546407 [Fimicolochytrium jonesii]